ncbi:MAG: glycosyl hydrolase family 39 [Silvibacterium sp.]|nr:glycosyl hydrolase family 39 [Silvibacterium sp.]MBV8438812.1 glycosyl hydrolase family 39 [Silvibacterium sp.]
MLPRTLSALVLLFALIPALPAQTTATVAPEKIDIDAHASSTPLPHFWDQMFGSGRAVLAMRQSYRDDMQTVKKITDFKYVRFHAIFHDELGVYDEDQQGNPVFNFSYIDQIYDGLLANGVRPFVEISFMPKKLASRLDYHAFWYKQIVSPPRDYAKWDALITAFAQHLVERYGIDEVSQWYFEVWNEPNIDFWTGRPAQETYFELYDHTARALKVVNQRIRVGGPATAQAAWVDAMIAHATSNNVPLDFVSTHVYGNDTAKDVFGDDRPVPPHQMVCAAVSKVHDQIKASGRPDIPLIWSEFNATYANEQPITDSTYEASWLADTIRQCDGKVNIMSYWTFSDVFEEQGVVKTPFYGGYGIIAERGIPKPAFRAFEILHDLGDERLAEPGNDVLVTRRKDGSLVIALWNLVEPEATGPGRTFTLDIRNAHGSNATIRRVDAAHGDTLTAWKQMGSPRYPTEAQITALKKASEIGPPETASLHGNQLTVTVPPKGLAVVEIH